jgi:tetratricopeptide (TPR) repeat protein
MYQWVSESPVAPAFVRAIVARADIDEGSLNTAERLTASLPPGPQRADLEGDLLARDGNLRLAVSRFMDAGDTARVDAYVDNLVAAGSFEAAVTMQRLLVDRLRQLRDQGRLAQAEWRLAQIESATGDHIAAGRDYDAALRLIPLSETYLLGAANEALQFGSLHEAGEYFDSVVRLDPASLDGHIGVGRVAARQGDLVRARGEAEFVRAHVPTYPDLQTLEDEIARAKTTR